MNRLVTIAIIISMLLAITLTAGCANKKSDEEALKTVIRNNLKALQEENLENYLATLHPESPGYAQMEALCPKIFELYDLQHKLIEIKVLSISGDEARVRTVQEAIRLAGPENYRNNRSTTVHTLKKYKGQWRIFKTDQESMELLE
jgi:murein L,D-transpeptidase YcbB/YkuD